MQEVTEFYLQKFGQVNLFFFFSIEYVCFCSEIGGGKLGVDV